MNYLKKKYTTYVVVSSLVLLVLFQVFLVSNTFYIENGGAIHSASEGSEDMALHLTQITKFAYEQNFSLTEPIFVGENIHYPFLINLISGLILRFSGRFTMSLLLPLYLLLIANIVLIYLIYKKILKNNIRASMATWMFMLGSGVTAFNYFVQSIFDRVPFKDMMNDIFYYFYPALLKFDAAYPDQNVLFGAPLFEFFLHQRTFILGLFVFLVFFYLLLNIDLELRTKKNRLFMIGTAIAYGVLPIVHTHSFVAASVVLGMYGVIELVQRKWTEFKRLCMVVGGGFLLAIPQLYYLLFSSSAYTKGIPFTHFRLGWMVQPVSGSAQFASGVSPSFFSLTYLNFVWLNFGFILLVLVIGTIIYMVRHKKRSQEEIRLHSNKLITVLLLSSWVLFILVQIIQFQPWDFDNNKILVYYQFFAVPFTIWFLYSIFSKRKYVATIILGLYFIFATISGLVNLAQHVTLTKYDLPRIFTNTDRHLAEYIRQYIPNKQILTSTTYLNPVSSLAGRPVLVGSPDWLWSRGINYYPRENDIIAFYGDPRSNLDILKKYNIGYILLDEMAVKKYNSKSEDFDSLFHPEFKEGPYTLYNVNKY